MLMIHISQFSISLVLHGTGTDRYYMIYHVLDWFFIIFHSIIVIFNLFGWILRKTRRLNLYVLLITGASWFLLGIFYGMGFCFLTDWHWKVLHKLGQYDLPASYIQYIFHRLTGLDPGYKTANIVTVLLFFFSLTISLYVNIAPRFRKNKSFV